jgi:hypothetical protein
MNPHPPVKSLQPGGRLSVGRDARISAKFQNIFFVMRIKEVSALQRFLKNKVSAK